MRRRFADDQLRIGAGIEFNQKIADILDRGCAIFSSTGYITKIDAFRKFSDQMHPFFFSLPLGEPLANEFNGSTGCTALFYPPARTHPSIRNFIAGYVQARGLEKVHDDVGMELLVSRP